MDLATTDHNQVQGITIPVIAATPVAALESEEMIDEMIDETDVVNPPDHKTTVQTTVEATVTPIGTIEVAPTMTTVEPETTIEPKVARRTTTTGTAADATSLDHSITATVMDGSRSTGSRTKAVHTFYPDTPSVLLDSGASTNYITYSTCKKLNIPLLNSEHLIVKSVHGQTKCKHKVIIPLFRWYIKIK